MSGGFTFTEGHTFQNPTDILLDEYYATQRKVHAGDKVNILHRDWNVAGIVEPGKLSHLFLELPVLQEMIGASGKVSQIYLKLDNPDNTQAVIDNLKRQVNGYPISVSYTSPTLAPSTKT